MKKHPAHWILDLILLLMLGMLVLIARARLSPLYTKLLLIGATGLGYSLMVLWVRSNRRELNQEAQDKQIEQEEKQNGRTLPQTNVQRRFLEVMRRQKQGKTDYD